MTNNKSNLTLVSQNPKDFNFPKGKYIILDLCYIYSDIEWSDFCNKSFEKSGCSADIKGCVWEYNGIKFFTCRTAFGDGCFPIKKGNKILGHCGVDAGLLALVPLELARTWPEYDSKGNLGIKIEVNKYFTIQTFGKNEVRPGNWKFLNYKVITE